MDMRLSSTAATTSTGSVAEFKQRKQGAQDLAAALKSGDLAAAQTAYAEMTKDGTGKLASHPNSLMAKLGDALKAGDMAGAQKVAAEMALHHHHRTSGEIGKGGGTAPQPSGTTATTGNNLNVVA